MTEILLAINTALLAYLTWLNHQRRTSHVSLDKVIDGIAGRLLDGYANDLRAIGEPSTRDYARVQYVQLCADYGFPIAATDKVIDGVWAIINEAQGNQPKKSSREVELYG